MDLNQLQSVNTEINKLPYVTALGPNEGYDIWKDTPDNGSWVCRDYVLLKAERLGKLGWISNQLNIILCWTEFVLPRTNPANPMDGREYHAVLGVHDPYTQKQDTYILDSRVDQIYQLKNPPYNYVWDRIQISGTTTFTSMSQYSL